ncbi:hypothetical protein RUND412_008865 [Rhizina undulata]
MCVLTKVFCPNSACGHELSRTLVQCSKRDKHSANYVPKEIVVPLRRTSYTVRNSRSSHMATGIKETSGKGRESLSGNSLELRNDTGDQNRETTAATKKIVESPPIELPAVEEIKSTQPGNSERKMGTPRSSASSRSSKYPHPKSGSNDSLVPINPNTDSISPLPTPVSKLEPPITNRTNVLLPERQLSEGYIELGYRRKAASLPLPYKGSYAGSDLLLPETPKSCSISSGGVDLHPASSHRSYVSSSKRPKHIRKGSGNQFSTLLKSPSETSSEKELGIFGPTNKARTPTGDTGTAKELSKHSPSSQPTSLYTPLYSPPTNGSLSSKLTPLTPASPGVSTGYISSYQYFPASSLNKTHPDSS